MNTRIPRREYRSYQMLIACSHGSQTHSFGFSQVFGPSIFSHSPSSRTCEHEFHVEKLGKVSSPVYTSNKKKLNFFGHFRAWRLAFSPFHRLGKNSLVSRSSSSLKVLLHIFQLLQSLLGWAIVDLFHVLLIHHKIMLAKSTPKKNGMGCF